MTIGYTYEDSTVPEPNQHSDKEEDNSENSDSEEDEGIPDIGEHVTHNTNLTSQKKTEMKTKQNEKAFIVREGKNGSKLCTSENKFLQLKDLNLV